MTDTTPEPSWIREGGTVALEHANRSVTFETIERLTATQIILVGGRRFRRGGNHAEMLSDNGYGHRTNRDGHLYDPNSKHLINLFARQQLREVAREARSKIEGSGATIYQMDAADVRAELDRIQDILMAARKEVDRRAGL